MDAFRRVDLHYRLATPSGLSATTQTKSWFFAIPKSRDDAASWLELLHRIFYDANVALRRREPSDPAWLALDSHEVAALDPLRTLAWTGKTDDATAREFVPWFLAQRKVVWEFAASLVVDDAGRYDGLSPYDYSELMLYRALAACTVDEAGAIAFLQKLYPKPGAGQRIYGERAARLANIEVVRPTPLFRKGPGTEPIASGPPRAEHLGA